jgi:hypothetical protein
MGHPNTQRVQAYPLGRTLGADSAHAWAPAHARDLPPDAAKADCSQRLGLQLVVGIALPVFPPLIACHPKGIFGKHQHGQPI